MSDEPAVQKQSFAETVRTNTVVVSATVVVFIMGVLGIFWKVYDFLDTYKREITNQTEVVEDQFELDQRWEKKDDEWNAQNEKDHNKTHLDINEVHMEVYNLRGDIRELRDHMIQLRLEVRTELVKHQALYETGNSE